MKKLLLSIYNQTPILKYLKKHLKIPTPIVEENIVWNKGYKIKFKFMAPLPIAQKAKEKGIESTMLQSALKLLDYNKEKPSDKVVIDVGANWGFLSIVFASTVCHPNGKVLAFEPHPKIFKTLMDSIKVNHLEKTVNLNNVAIGAENTNVRINLFSGSSNILKPSDKSIIVKQITLDSFIDKINSIDLVKVDVDGYEYNVLLGSEKIIEKFQPIWIVETNNDERIIPFFLQRGYNIFDLHMNKVSEEIPDNIICLPNIQPLVK